MDRSDIKYFMSPRRNERNGKGDRVDLTSDLPLRSVDIILSIEVLLRLDGNAFLGDMKALVFQANQRRDKPRSNVL
jgi:hypothetical protein